MSGFRSLADTHAEGVQIFAPEQVPVGRGCLLQSYPARPNSEMIRLNKKRTLIGRDFSCDVTLDDTSVSRTHASINADELGYTLLDLGSTNGTYVDDQPVGNQHRLNGGELIRMGSTILKFMSSIDEEAHYHALVHELMTRDPLTNAFNRAYLIPTLETLLLRTGHQQSELCLILMDIDFFKNVNDTYGHATGDEVLRIFCQRVRGSLRPDEILARIGGEEFVVVVENTELREVRRIAERIRLTISSAPFLTQAGSIVVTCSLGLATSKDHDSLTVDQFMAVADHWLYAAKNSGRNNVQPAIDVTPK